MILLKGSVVFYSFVYSVAMGANVQAYVTLWGHKQRYKVELYKPSQCLLTSGFAIHSILIQAILMDDIVYLCGSGVNGSVVLFA